MRLILDIDAGTAILADQEGNQRLYRRTGQGVERAKLCHATWDDQQGCAIRTKLLESEQSPDLLFIRHRQPGRARTPVGQLVFSYEPIG